MRFVDCLSLMMVHVHTLGLHELLFGAFRADDVFGVRDESSTHQRCLARGADEAIVVPMAVLERDESSAADSCKKDTN